MGKAENNVQDSICKYLEAKRYLFSRLNTTGVYDTKKNIFRKLSKYTLKGMSDIIVFTKGQTVFIECKAETSMSEDQRTFQQNVEDEGFIYILAQSIDDVKACGL